MRLRRAALLSTLCSAVAFAACTLNPQPLPPGEDQSGEPSASPKKDAGGSFGNSDASPAGDDDAAPPPQEAGGGTDGSNDADGGTGDAATDAPTDAPADG